MYARRRACQRGGMHDARVPHAVQVCIVCDATGLSPPSSWGACVVRGRPHPEERCEATRLEGWGRHLTM